MCLCHLRPSWIVSLWWLEGSWFSKLCLLMWMGWGLTDILSDRQRDWILEAFKFTRFFNPIPGSSGNPGKKFEERNLAWYLAWKLRLAHALEVKCPPNYEYEMKWKKGGVIEIYCRDVQNLGTGIDSKSESGRKAIHDDRNALLDTWSRSTGEKELVLRAFTQ